ncbi:MAG: 3'-5' exonuclease, partial [bacterium]
RHNRIGFTAPFNTPGNGLPIIVVLADWLKNNQDSISFRTCIEAFINSSESGIPSKRSRKEEKLLEREQSYSIVSALWKPVISKSVESLWQSLVSSKDTHPLLRRIHDSFSRINQLTVEDDDVATFLGMLAHDLAPWNKISQCLSELSAWIENGEQLGSVGSADTQIRIMTMQGAKGLEAKIVIVLGLEEGSIPRSDNSEEISEQSRLLYVSMTRAIDELHLFHARTRSASVAMRAIYKGKGAPDIQPSRFLNVIPEKNSEKRFHPA